MTIISKSWFRQYNLHVSKEYAFQSYTNVA